MKAVLLALLLSGCCCLPRVPGLSAMTLKAVDPSGKPVAGAVVGWEEKALGAEFPASGFHELGTTDSEGKLPFLRPRHFYALWVNKGSLRGSVMAKDMDPSHELTVPLKEAR